MEAAATPIERQGTFTAMVAGQLQKILAGHPQGMVDPLVEVVDQLVFFNWHLSQRQPRGVLSRSQYQSPLLALPRWYQ